MQIQRPVRAQHTYTQRLLASPEQVFPLLCPVRETEWARGWNPRLVISTSGYAEAGCIFLTPAEEGESIWVVTGYQPEQHRIAFLKVTPGYTAGEIAIELYPEGSGSTAAKITYAFTALSPEGERKVADFTADAYAEFMREWEAELNHFLQTGRPLHDP